MHITNILIRKCVILSSDKWISQKDKIEETHLLLNILLSLIKSIKINRLFL
jgi:hypothetical protein